MLHCSVVLYSRAIYCNHAGIILHSSVFQLRRLCWLHAAIMLHCSMVTILQSYCNHTGNILHQLCKLSCFHAAIILLSCWNNAAMQHDLNNNKPQPCTLLPCCNAAYMLVSCCIHAVMQRMLNSYWNHTAFMLEIIPFF